MALSEKNVLFFLAVAVVVYCKNECDTASGGGDVHIKHAAGGRTDFKGYDGSIFNVLQTCVMSVSALFKYANFTLASNDPRAEAVREVHGSFMAAIYVTAITDRGLVKLEYGESNPYKARLQLATTSMNTTLNVLDMWVSDVDDGPITIDNLAIEMVKAQPLELRLTSPHWRLGIQPGTYRDSLDGTRQTRMDLSIVALTEPLAAAVAPHGLVGQGFDGIHIDGRQDDYVPNELGIFKTTAQGEGALEGSADDYLLKDQKDPFSTNFTFGRFEATSAQPRNTSKLNSPSGRAAPRGMKGAEATAEYDPGRRLADCEAPTEAPTKDPTEAQLPNCPVALWLACSANKSSCNAYRNTCP